MGFWGGQLPGVQGRGSERRLLSRGTQEMGAGGRGREGLFQCQHVQGRKLPENH